MIELHARIEGKEWPLLVNPDQIVAVTPVRFAIGGCTLYGSGGQEWVVAEDLKVVGRLFQAHGSPGSRSPEGEPEPAAADGGRRGS